MEILITEPGVIPKAQKTRLRKAGIEVIETYDPSTIRRIQAESEFVGSDLLRCALKAMDKGYGTESQGRYVKYMLEVLERTRPTAEVERDG